ncbi:MAG: carboxyl transferase domain-containing protein [Nitrospira sp.]
MAAVRRFLAFLPSNARAPASLRPTGDPPDRRHDKLLDLVPANTRKSYDVRRVIAAIADTGSGMEIKPAYAPNVVTTMARLDGRPVGFIANQPQRLGGMLDSPACEKAAHFIALCDAYGLPLIYLVDIPGFSIGSPAERSMLGRRSAKLLYELGHATVPRISVILRKGYGLGYRRDVRRPQLRCRRLPRLAHGGNLRHVDRGIGGRRVSQELRERTRPRRRAGRRSSTTSAPASIRCAPPRVSAWTT